MVLQSLVWCILLSCQQHQMGIDEADHECIFPGECLQPGTIWWYWGSKMWHTRQLLAWYITCINIQGILRGDGRVGQTEHDTPALYQWHPWLKHSESVRYKPNDWYIGSSFPGSKIGLENKIWNRVRRERTFYKTTGNWGLLRVVRRDY